MLIFIHHKNSNKDFRKISTQPTIYQGFTPIQNAIIGHNNGFSEVVEILAPLAENPNSPDPHGITPIQFLMNYCHNDDDEKEKKVLKILVSMSDDPNAPDPHGVTPLEILKGRQCHEMVKILEELLICSYFAKSTSI